MKLYILDTILVFKASSFSIIVSLIINNNKLTLMLSVNIQSKYTPAPDHNFKVNDIIYFIIR